MIDPTNCSAVPGPPPRRKPAPSPKPTTARDCRARPEPDSPYRIDPAAGPGPARPLTSGSDSDPDLDPDLDLDLDLDLSPTPHSDSAHRPTSPSRPQQPTPTDPAHLRGPEPPHEYPRSAHPDQPRKSESPHQSAILRRRHRRPHLLADELPTAGRPLKLVPDQEPHPEKDPAWVRDQLTPPRPFTVVEDSARRGAI